MDPETLVNKLEGRKSGFGIRDWERGRKWEKKSRWDGKEKGRAE